MMLATLFKKRVSGRGSQSSVPELSIAHSGHGLDLAPRPDHVQGPVREKPTGQGLGTRDKKDGVLTAPGNELHHLDPSLAEKCALVRDGGVLTLYALESARTSAALDSFRRSAAMHLAETIPEPIQATPRQIRDFNVQASEVKLSASSGTGSRARLKDMIWLAAANQTNDLKMDIIDGDAMVRLQKDNSLSAKLSRYDMTAPEATALITSAFNYADQGDPIEKPTQDQKFTITNPAKLPPNVQTIRGQTAVREDGRRLDLRFIYKSTEISKKGLEDIGLLQKHLEALYLVQNMGAGLFTITAPTDNGKSTTLNLFSIDYYKSRGGHVDVVGIDDPVEFMAPEICQLAMYETEDGVDPYAQKIHTTLRLAPHAIKIGECRTLFTAEGAIDASVTGRLVMTTQHTTGAFGVPFRYQRMGVSRQVAYDPAVHICWMSQRLVPALCPDCRIKITELPKEIENDIRRMATINRFRRVLGRYEGDFYVRGSGCPECNKNGSFFHNPGVIGRVLAAEVILPDRELCVLLAQENEYEARRRTIIHEETPTMALHGFQLMKQGRIGIEEFMNAIAKPTVLRDDLEAEDERIRNAPLRRLDDHRDGAAAE